MEIVIIGAGALGKCMAGLLAKHASITLYERDPETRRVLAHGGFIFQNEQSAQTIRVQLIESPEEVRDKKIDLLVFATKVTDLRKAVAEAEDLNPRCIFLPQNGIFDMEWLNRSFNKSRICRGVTTMACQETGHDRVRLFFRGHVYVGGDGARLVAGLLRKAGVRVRTCRNPDGAVWAKLIFSAVMNVLPVITGGGYRVLRDDPEIWRLVKQAINEGKAIAKVRTIRLAFDPMKLIERVRDGDLAGIKHRGSMIGDANAGRSTELDFITGALIRHARKERVKTPALDLIFSQAREAGA